MDEARRILRAGAARGPRRQAPRRPADRRRRGRAGRGGGCASRPITWSASRRRASRAMARGRGGGGEPAAGLALPGPASGAGPPADRGRRAGGGGDRFQSRLGAELSPAAGADARLHAAADDAGGGAEGRHHLSPRGRSGSRTRVGLARAGKGGRLRRASMRPTSTSGSTIFAPNACVMTGVAVFSPVVNRRRNSACLRLVQRPAALTVWHRSEWPCDVQAPCAVLAVAAL